MAAVLRAMQLPAESKVALVSVAFARDRFKPDFDINNLRSRAIEDLTKTNKLDFNEQFQQYIESKRKKVANASINVFHETWRYLQAFEIYRNEKFTFESFTYEFYDALVDSSLMNMFHIATKTCRDLK